MATLTIRVTENKAERLKSMAAKQGISVNKLIDELATYAIAEFDAQTRFELRAARGNATRGKAMLEELDEYYGSSGSSPRTSDSYVLHDKDHAAYEHMKPSKKGKKKKDD